MKKFFASVLAVSMAVTGIYTTAYASGDTPMVSIEAQKSNPYMSEIDKELKDFFAKYNAETNSEKKDELLDTAINEVKSKLDSYTPFLNVISDFASGDDFENKIENKFAALKLKHSILSTVKTKEQEKRTAVAQKEQEKQTALDEKDRELQAKNREMQVALDKKEKENKLEIEKLIKQAGDSMKKIIKQANEESVLGFMRGMICGGVLVCIEVIATFIFYNYIHHGTCPAI